MKKFSIGVLGAGTWGMALARMLTVSGNDVQVWSAIEAEVDNLSTTRVHPNLPGMVIPQELRFTKSIEEVCTGKDVLLFAVPSVFVRATAAKARPYIRSGQIIVAPCKSRWKSCTQGAGALEQLLTCGLPAGSRSSSVGR